MPFGGPKYLSFCLFFDFRGFAHTVHTPSRRGGERRTRRATKRQRRRLARRNKIDCNESRRIGKRTRFFEPLEGSAACLRCLYTTNWHLSRDSEELAKERVLEPPNGFFRPIL
jgi:hypothetical protein